MLKNGCRIEALQLGRTGKTELALAVYMVASWRLARLVRMGRTHPDLEVTALFTDEEWKGAYILAKKPTPKHHPQSARSSGKSPCSVAFSAEKSTANLALKPSG